MSIKIKIKVGSKVQNFLHYAYINFPFVIITFLITYYAGRYSFTDTLHLKVIERTCQLALVKDDAYIPPLLLFPFLLQGKVETTSGGSESSNQGSLLELLTPFAWNRMSSSRYVDLAFQATVS